MKRIRKQMNKARKAGLTETDLLMVREMSKKAAAKVEKEATERAFLYMLAIPLNVLANDYWPKTAKRRTHKYIKDVLNLYAAVQEGIVSEQELADFLDEMAGIRVQAAWMTAKKEKEEKEHENS